MCGHGVLGRRFPSRSAPAAPCPPMWMRQASFALTSGIVNWEVRWAVTPSSPLRSLCVIHGQSARMSIVRFSAGVSTAGSRWSGQSNPRSGNLYVPRHERPRKSLLDRPCSP